MIIFFIFIYSSGTDDIYDGPSTSRIPDIINLTPTEDVTVDDGRVHPDSIALFDNADEIRDYVEQIVTERANKNGTVYELAGDGDNKCLVKSCANKKHVMPAARGFCRFHSSVGHLCIGLTNGRICSTDGCLNKSRIFEDFCERCYQLGPDKRAKEKCDKGRQWSTDKVLEEANSIAAKYADMVKQDPSLLMYFGITIRNPRIRLYEHLKSGKDFDDAVLEIEVPEAHSLAELEFEVVARFAELVGGRHLKNRTAGGDYWLPNMERAGVMYVLIFNNRVNALTPTPSIDFRCRHGSHFRKFPILTKQHHIELPRFNKIVGIADIMSKMGYDTKHSAKQAPKHREVGHKCGQCDHVATSMLALESHLKVHRNKGKHVYIWRRFMVKSCQLPNDAKRSIRVTSAIKLFHQLMIVSYTASESTRSL